MLTPSFINMCLLTAVDSDLISFEDYCRLKKVNPDQVIPAETILEEIRKRYGFSQTEPALD